MASLSQAQISGSGTPTRASITGTDATGTRAASPSTQHSSGNRGQPRTLSDKYQLGEELGRGAYGLVFRGIDTRTGQSVAIKQLSLAGISADTLHSIMGEIDLLKNLNHKNIVKYIGSFKTRTHLYIILEFMENGALSNIIKPTKFGAFPESLVAVYIAQVLHGLAYLHDQGVVHRDIKGANILTTKEGLVKLADFGVAARLSELEADRDKSRLSVVGTPYWMAPEVIEMTSTTPASDIWSVACLAIELLTGQPPYFDLQPMSALFRIVQDEGPELPADVSTDMTDFLQQCFQKDPQRRPTARQLLKHRWVTYNRQTLRSSWSRTQGMKSRGQKTDAHVSVSTVVERILQAEADEFAASAAAAAQGRQEPPTPKVPAQIPMNQTRASAAESRGSGLDQSSTVKPEAVPFGTAQDAHGIAEAPTVTPPFATAAAGSVQTEQTLLSEVIPERVSLDVSRVSSRANSIRLQPQRGLLEAIFRIGGPGTKEAGEDLMQWLQQKERSHTPDAMLPDNAKTSGEDVVDGAISKHQEVAEVRRQIAAVRTAYGREKGSRDGDPANATRTATAVEAGRALVNLCREDADRIEGFLSEDGAVVVIELLQEPCSEQVALLGLELLNELVSLDTKTLGSAALLGVVPAVMEYAAGAGPPEIARSNELRLQASLFIQQLAQLNLVTAQLLIACKGLPVLVGLIEPSFREHGRLIHVGVNCIWRLLELHATLSINQICRLLAAAGLASNLVHALRSGTALAKSADSKRATSSKQQRLSGRLETLGSLQAAAADRTVSHSQATASQENVVLPRARSSGSRSGLVSGTVTDLDATEALHALLDKMGSLLLVMAHADTAVKATLCQPDTLKTLFSAIEYAPESLQLTALKAIKNLTTDPSMLEALQAAGTIESLGRYLNADSTLPVQVEALHALHNLCKISRLRQEGAAKAGLVPYLMTLAQMSPQKVETEPLQEELRQMAVSLLCGMAHSTHLTRNYLWTNNGLHTLLDLLREQDWQGPALDALAVWLAEDPGRIEPRLTQRSPVESFVQLFALYTTEGGCDALARLLEPFLRILRRSPQITVEVAVAGLAGIVVEMLRTASALTALSLLQMVKVIYEHHPRPKEFVAKYAISDRLRELSRQQNSSVLVKKQATHLLHAFQINSIF